MEEFADLVQNYVERVLMVERLRLEATAEEALWATDPAYWGSLQVVHVDESAQRWERRIPPTVACEWPGHA